MKTDLLIFTLFLAGMTSMSLPGWSQELPSISGLQLHLDASDESSLTVSGGNVVEWRNVGGGNTISFVPTSSAALPIFEPNAVNGRPGVVFLRTPMETSDPDALGILNDVTGITFFGIGWSDPDFGDARQVYLSFDGAETTTRAQFFQSTGALTGNGLGLRRRDSDSFVTIATGVDPRHKWEINTSVVDYANAFASVSLGGVTGVAQSVLTPGSTDSTDSTLVRLGANGLPTPSTQWGGYIAEIIVYNRVLSASERAEVGMYLAQKYDLPYEQEADEVVITGFHRASAVSFATVADREYEVLQSDDGEAWESVFETSTAGTGEVVHLELPTLQAPEFIRVVESRQEEHVPQTGSDPVLPEISNLGVHLDASAADTLTLNGAAVEEWRTVNNSDIGFVPVTHAPQFETDVLNGRSAINFSRTPLETVSSAAQGLLNDVSGITFFGIGWSDSTLGHSTIQQYISFSGTDAPTRAQFYHRTDSSLGTGVGLRRLDSDPFVNTVTGINPRLKWEINTSVVDYANAFVTIDIGGRTEAARTVLTPGNSDTSDSLRVRVGGNSAPTVTHEWGGYISEILVFNRVLSQEERDQVGVYLSDKYDLPYGFTIEEDIAFDATSGVRLEFSGVAGNLYDVEMSENLVDWVVARDSITATDEINSAYFPTDELDRAFFRVKSAE